MRKRIGSQGVEADIVTWNTVIHGVCKEGRMNEAAAPEGHGGCTIRGGHRDIHHTGRRVLPGRICGGGGQAARGNGGKGGATECRDIQFGSVRRAR